MAAASLSLSFVFAVLTTFFIVSGPSVSPLDFSFISSSSTRSPPGASHSSGESSAKSARRGGGGQGKERNRHNGRMEFASAESTVSRTDGGPVTYASVVELVHRDTGFKLWSNSKIQFGSGSKQQAATAIDEEFSRSTLWIVKEGHGLVAVGAGEPVKCGAEVRFEHLLSQKNLHGYALGAPLSPNYEVSLFAVGDSGDGEGDSGDTFIVECEKKKGDNFVDGDPLWNRRSAVALRHKDLQGLLTINKSNMFTSQNCPRCPIIGHLEVSVDKGRMKAGDSKAAWLVSGGLRVSHTDDLDDNMGDDLEGDGPTIGRDRPSRPSDSPGSPPMDDNGSPSHFDFDSFFSEL